MSNAQQMYSNESLPSRPFQDSHHLTIFNALTLLEGRQCCYFCLSLGEWKHGEIKYLPQGDPKYLFQNRRISGLGTARGASLPPVNSRYLWGTHLLLSCFLQLVVVGCRSLVWDSTPKSPSVPSPGSSSLLIHGILLKAPGIVSEGTRRRRVCVTRLCWHVWHSFNDSSRRREG